ncbi:SIMPL domain-containing protein [Clostridium sp. C2-6-12]|uniref:SIMPL domain-containing protein n=1 Tax=Clostridium sp. C2-6-12 TaxID=2698832 RepID=UPI0013709625|nr:SIMPL domain-containing protein [Clostridium sp. C2-6-12]
MFRLVDNNDYSFEAYARGDHHNKLEVFGKGVVNVKPDAAEVVVGIKTENPQLEIAQEENAAITRQVISNITKIGVLPRYIQTQNYNIRTNYDYIDGKQVFRGYEVSNDLKVYIRNLELAGEIIDTAVKGGANNVEGIRLIVSDQTTYYYESLRLALTDAQNKARVIGEKLNVNINIIPIEIKEHEIGDITPFGTMTLKEVSSATPIVAGENKIIAEIGAIFKYSE